ncbi:MAG: malic enzyme-like NAD(P)-binding protein [Oscillospiraceae bacterium]
MAYTTADYNRMALELHEKHQGKIEVVSKVSVKTKEDLAIAYTPGVAEPCRKIHEDKENAYKYTAKRNLVAVVTDGTAVLGLGNIGPEAAMPVMEGKSILFKSFGNVDAFPICLDTTDTEEIIKTVKYLAPTFGGINLEDIGAPKCFEIEQRLEKELDIPVFHDDQHGTAIVVTAALLNAAKIVGKELKDLKVVLNGAGAAGTAILKMFMFAGVKDVIACDSKGTIYMGRKGCEDGYKLNLAETTNPRNIQGGLADALVGADVFVGVSVANCLTKEMVATMNKDPMVFAMANPDPEIAHDLAMECGIKVMGTGRSDYPNQINNVLCFPGIFRGALDVNAREINYDMKMAAAYAIASLISPEELNPEYVIPSPFDERVAPLVAKMVGEAAIRTGAIRK